ncbi:hypothetical protein I4U23_031474 [Adineta vaga]|nr:hypothetical protein I4U23_031474 [Adineta vaga]
MLIIPLTLYIDHYADNRLRVLKVGDGLMHLGWNLKLTLLQEQISLNHFYADAHRITRLFRSAGGTTRAATLIEEFLEFVYQHLIFNQLNYKQLVILYTLVLITIIVIIAPLLLLLS